MILQGELNQQRGLVPSNFLEAEPSDGGMAEELHSKDKEAFPLSAESQVRLCVSASYRHPTVMWLEMGIAQHAASDGII